MNQKGIQNCDDDSLLDEFFAEIENLKINDENDGDEGKDTNNETQSKTEEHRTEIPDHPLRRHVGSSPQKQKQKEQKSMIDQAETTKDNWKKFIIAMETSSSSPSPASTSVLDSIGRKPISFSLAVGTKPRKKKNTKITRRQPQQTRQAETSLAFDVHEASSPPPPPPQSSFRRKDCATKPYIQDHFLLPRWIAVLDTCAILEFYESVCAMIQLAREAAAAAAATAGASNSYHQHPSRVNAVQSHDLLEPLTIVVPYTVWDELDYRSKEVDDEHQKYKARRAARMLTDELLKEEQQQQPQQQKDDLYDQTTRKLFSKSGASTNTESIRSQSRIEAHHAVEEFVLLSKASSSKEGIPNNDDKILACALWEQDRLAKAKQAQGADVIRIPTAGGVVLITSDKVLTGKARADHLSVYSPSEFVRYYNKRMASLQSRASASAYRGSSTKLPNQTPHAH